MPTTNHHEESNYVLTRMPDSPLTTDVLPSPLPLWQRLYGYGWLRKSLLLAILASLWQWYAHVTNNALLIPSFTEALAALWTGILSGEIGERVVESVKVLLAGYGLGLLFATALTAFAAGSKIGADLLETLTAMFNPLPAIAILPLAMLWFGIGHQSLIFVLVHSVVWSVAVNTHAGFLGVSPTLRMVGRNYGLSGPRYFLSILVPAAFPNILTGLKIGWAFAWRTLIASELVFGVSAGSGGLGWYIYESKNQLEIAKVFAGLLVVIVIGLLVENLIFRVVERVTVRRWGMQQG